MPRTILDATASMLLYPPGLGKNTDRKGPFDAFDGHGAGFYNELSEFLRVNLTLIGAEELGHCSDNSSEMWKCTGIVGDLQNKVADFTFARDELKGYNHDMGQFPFTVGIPSGVLDTQITSMPVLEAKKSFTTMADTFKDLPPSLCMTVTLVYLLSILLINLSIRKRKWIPRFGPMSLLAVTVLTPYRCFRQSRSRLAYLSCLLTGFYAYLFFSGSVQSDMVTMIPATYVESMKEVLTYNRTPVFMGGLQTHMREFVLSKDPLRQALAKKSSDEGYTVTAEDAGALPSLAAKIKEGGIGFLETIYITKYVGVMICISTDYNHNIVRKLKSKPLFPPTNAFTLWRKDIFLDKPRLARRFKDVFGWYLEGGIWVRRNNDMILVMRDAGIAVYHKAILCTEQMSKTVHDELVIKPVTLQSLEGYFLLMVMSYGCCFVFLIFENIYRRFTRKYFNRSP